MQRVIAWTLGSLLLVVGSTAVRASAAETAMAGGWSKNAADVYERVARISESGAPARDTHLSSILVQMDATLAVSALLGKDYAEYADTFKYLARPVRAGASGLLIEGRDGKDFANAASMLAMYPDGRFVAAYRSSPTSAVRYYSTAASSEVDPLVQVWLLQSGPDVPVEWPRSGVASPPVLPHATWDEPSQMPGTEGQERVRAYAAALNHRTEIKLASIGLGR